ncbi:prepilin-type N-terminal cleavage/methylation domain-containing protein [Photobacterium damselae subsp. damselae]|uniref:type IV pilus modification PilV family protein n=1 Tax=Photobacterium damselae TaxID=38293 RepID=UPI00311B41CC
MTSKTMKSQGFSLLEVVISLAVLSVGVLGLVKMQAYMEVKAENTLKTLDALHIAESQMENYQRRANISSASAGVGNLIPFSDMDDNSKYCLKVEAQLKGFNLDCDADLLSLSGALRTIEVKVSWSDRHGASQAVSLKTALSKYSEFD